MDLNQLVEDYRKAMQRLFSANSALRVADRARSDAFSEVHSAQSSADEAIRAIELAVQREIIEASESV